MEINYILAILCLAELVVIYFKNEKIRYLQNVVHSIKKARFKEIMWKCEEHKRKE